MQLETCYYCCAELNALLGSPVMVHLKHSELPTKYQTDQRFIPLAFPFQVHVSVRGINLPNSRRDHYQNTGYYGEKSVSKPFKKTPFVPWYIFFNSLILNRQDSIPLSLTQSEVRKLLHFFRHNS